MSDDDALDITHGGAISVDTEVLRDVATRLAAQAARVDEAAADAMQAHRWIVEATGLSDAVDTVALRATADDLVALRTSMDTAATGTALMADAYELVELRAQRDLLALSDAAAADELQMQIHDLEAKDERLAPMAEYLLAGWEQGRYEGVHEQFDGLDFLGIEPEIFINGVTMLGGSALLGKRPPGFQLRGASEPVTVRPVRTSTPPTSTSSLAEAFRRFPEAPGAQMKVEKYTYADGSHRFVLYAKGTQSALYGGTNPWDMKSNLALYAGDRGASYTATVEALRMAGAEPGDTVDIYAHSQGGMIASYVAMAGEFDTQVLVTAGSPLEPSLGDDQLLIQLRHSDDLVNALAGGGSPDGTGSPDSFVALREAHPASQPSDLLLGPHLIDTYIETAEMIDDSTDPRVDAYREYLAELASAETVESTEYRADRSG